MNKQISSVDIYQLSKEFIIPVEVIKTVIAVESSGKGFDNSTGKILIQFEPNHFKKYTGRIIPNGIEGQTSEWKAFESAVKINRQAALLSTSWGLSQIMGFNYKLAGYKTVEDMVRDFEISEYYHVRAMLMFVKNNLIGYKALLNRDWSAFASFYNGSGFKELAKKFNTKPYDQKLAEAYSKISKNGNN